jgi:hypothetical protein
MAFQPIEPRCVSVSMPATMSRPVPGCDPRLAQPPMRESP